MSDDLVSRFIRRARLEHPQTPEIVWQRLERQIRQDEGGKKAYVLTNETAASRERRAPKHQAGDVP